MANAWNSYVDLTPASPDDAAEVKDAWAPLLSGQEIPLIGEQDYGYQPRKDDPDEFWSR